MSALVYIKKFNIENEEKLTQLYLKSDVLLLACVFEKFLKKYPLTNLVSIVYTV